MRKLLFSVLFLFPAILFSQTTDIRIPAAGGSVGNADSLGGQTPAFYLNRTNHTGFDSTDDIVGFQDSVTANTNVDANTTHRTSDGNDHAFIDQDVTSGSSPTFDGTNITGILVDTITGDLAASQITNFQDSVTANTNVTANTVHKSSDGSDHSFIDQSIVSGSSPSFNGKNIKGVEAFFLQPRGLFGSGPGFADEGFIGDLPVILFNANATEKAIYTFFSLGRIILTDTNPSVNFIVYSTTAPVATTSDSVRWQLEARYIAETELATKTPDETFLVTQGLPTTAANSRQTVLQFILDRTLIADQDVLLFSLSRIGGDGSDIYSADVGIGQSGILAETRNNNE